MKKRNRSRPKTNPSEAPAPRRMPPAPKARPQYFSLVIQRPTEVQEFVNRDGSLVLEPGEPIVVIPRGVLGLCEARGMQVANYGMFFEVNGGRRVWGKPLRIEIEPVKNDEESDGRRDDSDAGQSSGEEPSIPGSTEASEPT